MEKIIDSKVIEAAEIKFNDDGSAEVIQKNGEKFTITSEEYTPIPTPIYKDPNIFTDEILEKYNSLPSYERANFVIEIIDDFYRKNPEYAVFTHETIYRDPDALLEFFQKIKKSHFKKAGISDINFNAFQKKLEEVEIEIANNPIDYNDIKITQIWPILSLRDYFLESDLAALYYIQNPKLENELAPAAPLLSDTVASIPFGPYLFLLDEAIAHAAVNRGFKNDLTKGHRKKTDRNKEIILKNLPNGFTISEKKDGVENSITILNKDLIKSTTALKMFIFLLMKASQNNFRPEFNITYQELVNIKMYSTLDSARIGFENNINIIQSFQIEGKIKKGRKVITSDNNRNSGGGPLFYYHKYIKNGAKIYLNEKMKYESLASYYALFPAWAFGLSNNAFEILLYIFMRSRTEKKSKFNISLAIIRDKLALPKREEYEEQGKKFKPAQYVKTPILNAIEDIENLINQNKDTDIIIKKHLVVNDKNLDEWLKGFIEVELTGNYSNNLTKITSKQNRILEERLKNSRKKEE